MKSSSETPLHRYGGSGFSMVELLLAAFILSIGLLGLISLQVASVAQAANGRGRTTAAYIANTLLQRAQMEGQHYYFAKSNGLTPAMTAVFTVSPGTAVTNTNFGRFNVDGIQVQQWVNSAWADVTGLSTLVPDVNKQGSVYTASWARRAYVGTSPASTAQSQEFVVNVSWVESQQPKYLSVSRNIRY